MIENPCTRTDKAVRWVAFHAGELAGLAVPVLLAVTLSAWFGLLAVVASVWWVAHEVRDHRRQQEIRAAADRRRITTHSATAPTKTTEPRKEALS
jgi:hypothetical protein